ncbi:VWA domain-containing protein [Candidatus Woesearchaeota archaeon]|nr:VWA domain-containing protein [Candidatus Woesearchaeota archaeon]
MVEVSFTNPEMVWFLLGLPVLVITHFLTLKLKKSVALKFSNFELLMRTAPARALTRAYGGALMGKDISILVLRFFTLAALILAVAGMVVIYSGKSTDFDYVVAIDVSNSMKANDLLPSRLDAAKNIASGLVDEVPFTTQIGLVVFSGTTRVVHDLTDEKKLIKTSIELLNTSMFGGTDLGGAIVAGTNLLSKSPKQKSLVLMTDGQSNIGMPLLDALEFAKRDGVTVHTIGIGTREGGFVPGIANATFQLDEGVLKSVAENGGGKYFRASDAQTIKEAYEFIAATKIARIKLKLAPYLLLFALIMLFVEWGIVNIKYRTVP